MTTANIKAEITGTVWKVLGQSGQEMEEDEPILIMESMKMEIPVVAPWKGRLAEVLVAEGQEVSEGETVAVIRQG